MRGLALALLALLAACQSAPQNIVDAEGVPMEVQVLDAGFVQFEGERIAVEFFLLEIRKRVRASWGKPAELPRVTVVVTPDAPGVDHRWISQLRDELYKAGVRFMSLE